MGIPGGPPPVLKYRTRADQDKEDGTSSNSIEQNNNWFGGRHQSEPHFSGNQIKQIKHFPKHLKYLNMFRKTKRNVRDEK